ncbi:MAG: cysteine--tRNA ligase [Chlamydiota bacterium]|jgi:cysteinyl-tRNA synthetase
MQNDLPFKLFNTETKQKEVVFPIDGKTLRFYACGPTVYNYAHIGNFRTYVFEDLLRRSLEFFGFQVKMVMNITDVDDKTIKGAKENNQSLEEYIKPYFDAFFEDLKTLHIKLADIYPKATDYIQEMIDIILDLLNKGYAYTGTDGCVYFSIKQFSNYGRLSHLKLQELKKGASQRVNADEYEKEEASDFVLWKAYDEKRDGKIYWDSPFGKGRPGWHLECSTMAMKILGKSIDIHAGGIDNMFPHHENEIAQSECYSGRQFVKIWVHSAHLVVEDKKMSKSLGNFYTLRDLLDKGYSGRQVRYLLMQAHYRTPLNFTMQGLESAKLSLDRLQSFIERINSLDSDVSFPSMDKTIEDAKVSFARFLADDLNISGALSVVFDFIRNIHSLCDKNALGKQDKKKIIEFLQSINSVLGVLELDKEEAEVPLEIKEALDKREEARKNKNWPLADELRDFILSKGYKIEDSPKGPYVKKA